MDLEDRIATQKPQFIELPQTIEEWCVYLAGASYAGKQCFEQACIVVIQERSHLFIFSVAKKHLPELFPDSPNTRAWFEDIIALYHTNKTFPVALAEADSDKSYAFFVMDIPEGYDLKEIYYNACLKSYGSNAYGWVESREGLVLVGTNFREKVPMAIKTRGKELFSHEG